jgi:hypothetical protein
MKRLYSLNNYIIYEVDGVIKADFSKKNVMTQREGNFKLTDQASKGQIIIEYDRSNTYQNDDDAARNMTGTLAVIAGNPQIVGTNSEFLRQLAPGDLISIGAVQHNIQSVEDDTHATLQQNFTGISSSSTQGVIYRTFYTLATLTSFLRSNTAQ